MSQYICKIATLDELVKKCDYEINLHPNNNMWIVFKKQAIRKFNNGSIIRYIGIFDDEIICEATAVIKENGFEGEISNYSGLLENNMAYLCGFRTNKEYEGNGYFSKLYHFMENDLKQKGYTKLSLGVSPIEIRNMQIYFHWGYKNFIKIQTNTFPSKDKNSESEKETAIYYYKNI